MTPCSAATRRSGTRCSSVGGGEEYERMLGFERAWHEMCTIGRW